MKCVYKVTTKFTEEDGTISRGFHSFNVLAEDFKSAVKKAEYIRKPNAEWNEEIDSVEFLAEINHE